MAYMSLDQFITDLPRVAQQAQARLAGHSGRFCLNTKQGRCFYIALEDGRIALPEHLDGPYDCTVTADEQVLLDLLNGKLNPVTALMLRRVSVQGDMSKLLSLARLIG